MAEPGKHHARTCPKAKDPEHGVCHCVAGLQGLARRREGLVYTGGDSTRAKVRRRRQLLRDAKKEVDW
jgi:hypothetical protein